MELGAGTGHKLSLTASVAGDLRFSASVYVTTDAAPPVLQGSAGGTGPKLLASIAGTSQDLVLGVATSLTRIEQFDLLNNSSTVVTTVTFTRTDGTNTPPIAKFTLLPGEWVNYAAGIWTHHDANGGVYGPESKVDVMLTVTGDVANSTTAFADITGMTYPVKAGKKYHFEAHIVHQTAATTTGSRFGVNGPASPTHFFASQISGETPGIAATNIAIGTATAYDTAMSASTTGPGGTNTLAIVTGVIVPSADGTLAIRFASEVASSALTVKSGWLRVREANT